MNRHPAPRPARSFGGHHYGYEHREDDAQHITRRRDPPAERERTRTHHTPERESPVPDTATPTRLSGFRASPWHNTPDARRRKWGRRVPPRYTAIRCEIFGGEAFCEEGGNRGESRLRRPFTVPPMLDRFNPAHEPPYRPAARPPLRPPPHAARLKTAHVGE